MDGRFIVLDGGEGAGKTVQIPLLAERLRKQHGLRVHETKQPGGSELGLKLREILLHGRFSLDGLTEVFLFEADRSHHMIEITQRLSCGEWVLCDRFTSSTIAYQSYGRGVERAIVDYMNTLAARGLMPDLEFFMKVDPEVGIARVNDRKDKNSRFDDEEIDFHRRVFKGFSDEVDRNPDRFVVIDANRSIEEVHEDLYSHVVSRLLDER